MKKASIYILWICIFLNCKNNDTDVLKKLTLNETLIRLDKGDHQFYYAEYKDSTGGDLTPQLNQELTKGNLRREFYVNKHDSIKEIRVRVLKENEIFDEIQLRAAMTFPLRNFKYIDIDCADVKSIIDKSAFDDQRVRENEKIARESAPKIDASNKALILSLIEKCGWQDIDSQLINHVFLIIQHMDSEFVARYYPVFLKYHELGHLSNLNYARLIDRLLMNNGFEQIYGTQIVDESFYAIKDEKFVNQRRKDLGLEPIEDVAKKFGFRYEMREN